MGDVGGCWVQRHGISEATHQVGMLVLDSQYHLRRHPDICLVQLDALALVGLNHLCSTHSISEQLAAGQGSKCWWRAGDEGCQVTRLQCWCTGGWQAAVVIRVYS